MKISTAKQICKQFLQDAVLRCQGGIDTEAILSMGDSISRIERDQGILLKDMEIARQHIQPENYALLYTLNGAIGQDQNAEYELSVWEEHGLPSQKIANT